MTTSSFNLAVSVLLLTGTAFAVRYAEQRKAGALTLPLSSIPRTIAGWSTTSEGQLTPAVLETLRSTSYVQRMYGRPGAELELFIAYYSEQRAGESIHTPKHCLPGAGWEVVETGTVEVPVSGLNPTVNKYVVQSQGERLLILYWYHSKSRIVANEYAAKLYLARDSILGGATDASIVRISVQDRPGALAQATSFAAALIPHVNSCFKGSAPESVALSLPGHADMR